MEIRLQIVLVTPPSDTNLSNLDDAACSFRQYVAALSRLLLDFGIGEYGWCNGCRADMSPI